MAIFKEKLLFWQGFFWVIIGVFFDFFVIQYLAVITSKKISLLLGIPKNSIFGIAMADCKNHPNTACF